MLNVTDSSIIELIQDRVTERLAGELQTALNFDDTTRAYVVRTGWLQDDPTNGVNVLVQANDQMNPGAWEHSIYTAGQQTGAVNDSFAAFEIGGGQLWWRRFFVQLKMFWDTSIKREDAIRLSHVVLSRAEHTLMRALFPVSVGPDSFDEYALAIYPIRSEVLQAGGDGQFISNGRILFQVLTGRDSI